MKALFALLLSILYLANCTDIQFHHSDHTSQLPPLPGQDTGSFETNIPPPHAATSLDISNTSSTSSSGGCVICAVQIIRESMNNTICPNMTCGHDDSFHRHCLQKWLDIRGSCPICRQQQPLTLCSAPYRDRIAESRRTESQFHAIHIRTQNRGIPQARRMQRRAYGGEYHICQILGPIFMLIVVVMMFVAHKSN